MHTSHFRYATLSEPAMLQAVAAAPKVVNKPAALDLRRPHRPGNRGRREAPRYPTGKSMLEQKSLCLGAPGIGASRTKPKRSCCLCWAGVRAGKDVDRARRQSSSKFPSLG